MSINWMSITALLGVIFIGFLGTWAAMSLCKDNEVAQLCVAGLMPPLFMGVGLLTVVIWPVLK